MTDRPAAAWLPLQDLVPWDQNPRDNASAVAEVVESIERFGFGAPIVARAEDLRIIAGHTRWEAAKALELEEVPVRLLDLSEAEASALALADNKLAELADWSDGLGDVLADLAAQDVDLEGLGWSQADLGRLLGPGVPEEEPETPEPPPEPRSRVGEVYQLGPHRLVCGDCTEEETWSLLQGKADAILTDPPYGMGLGTDFSSMKGGPGSKWKGHGGGAYPPIYGDSRPFDPRPIMGRHADTLEQFWFGADYYAESIPGRSRGSWLVWDKREGTQAAVFGSEFELCWSRVRHKRRMLRHSWSGFLSRDNAREAVARCHPAQKPTSLLRDILEQWCSPGGLILDPFAGSGSTLIGCAQTGRIAHLVEISPAYCDVIRQRWTAWALEHHQDPGPGALEAL